MDIAAVSTEEEGEAEGVGVGDAADEALEPPVPPFPSFFPPQAATVNDKPSTNETAEILFFFLIAVGIFQFLINFVNYYLAHRFFAC